MPLRRLMNILGFNHGAKSRWIQNYVTIEIRFCCRLYLKHNFTSAQQMCKSGRKSMGSRHILETVEQSPKTSK